MAKAFYKILQLPAVDRLAEKRYMNRKYLEAHGLRVELSDYEVVYSGYIAEQKTLQDTLDSIYEKLNQREKPEGYKGHSLSVSDIVYIRQGAFGGLYYVDSVGFWEVTADG